jgi:hypothetical protein
VALPPSLASESCLGVVCRTHAVFEAAIDGLDGGAIGSAVLTNAQYGLIKRMTAKSPASERCFAGALN